MEILSGDIMGLFETMSTELAECCWIAVTKQAERSGARKCQGGEKVGVL